MFFLFFSLLFGSACAPMRKREGRETLEKDSFASRSLPLWLFLFSSLPLRGQKGVKISTQTCLERRKDDGKRENGVAKAWDVAERFAAAACPRQLLVFFDLALSSSLSFFFHPWEVCFMLRCTNKRVPLSAFALSLYLYLALSEAIDVNSWSSSAACSELQGRSQLPTSPL